MTSLDKYSDKGQRQRIKRSRDLILRNAMKGWQGLLYSHKWLDVLTSESSPNRGHKKAAHLKYKRMGRYASYMTMYERGPHSQCCTNLLSISSC